MTTVITRYFDSGKRADAMINEFVDRLRFSRGILARLDTAAAVDAWAKAGRIADDTATAYKDKLAQGGAVVVVSAGYRPLGVAKIARTAMATMGAADMGDLPQEVKIKDGADPQRSILDYHPLMLTRLINFSRKTFHMAEWPIPLISRRKPFANALIDRHARMANFPIPLTIRTKPYTETIYLDKHARMANWPIDLLVPRARKYYARFPIDHLIPGHKYQAGFPIGHIVPGHRFMAKFPFGHLVPYHARMARWPFPLIIGAKQGENALIPGHKYMANFPIGHKSKRRPNTASIFSRHARMANFPIGLLSRRKPITASIIPRHGRMANLFLPLTLRNKRFLT